MRFTSGPRAPRLNGDVLGDTPVRLNEGDVREMDGGHLQFLLEDPNVPLAGAADPRGSAVAGFRCFRPQRREYGSESSLRESAEHLLLRGNRNRPANQGVPQPLRVVADRVCNHLRPVPITNGYQLPSLLVDGEHQSYSGLPHVGT